MNIHIAVNFQIFYAKKLPRFDLQFNYTVVLVIPQRPAL